MRVVTERRSHHWSGLDSFGGHVLSRGVRRRPRHPLICWLPSALASGPPKLVMQGDCSLVKVALPSGIDHRLTPTLWPCCRSRLPYRITAPCTYVDTFAGGRPDHF